MPAQNAQYFRDMLLKLATPEAPFVGMTHVLSLPNHIADIDEHEAIAHYEKALRRVETALRFMPLGTLALVPGQPMFLSPIVGAAKPSYRIVISHRDGGDSPMPADAFEGLGAVDIMDIVDRINTWASAPRFQHVDLEAEIAEAVKVNGDVHFAAAY